MRRKINKFTLNEIGDISWPEHLTMFTTPIRIAAMFGIKLIFWGENSQNEYGGPAGTEKNKFLDRRWLEEFGGLLGLRVSDLPLAADIPKKDLLLFDYPCDEILKKKWSYWNIYWALLSMGFNSKYDHCTSSRI